MFNKRKKIIFIVVTIIITILAAFYIVYRMPERFYVKFDNISDSTTNKILTLLEKEYPEMSVKVSDNEKYDLYLSHNKISGDHSLNFLPITKGLGIIPSSMRNVSKVDDKNISIPLELNHVELLLSKQHYNDLVINDQFSSLNDFIQYITPLKTPSYFPLIIAGKDDTSLLDFLSLMVISEGSSIKHDELLTLIEKNSDFNNILNLSISKDHNFKDILDELIEWRRDKVLHTEWLQFDKEIVLDFLTDDLAASAIMRLSDHRTYPKRVIKKYEAIPFSTNREKKYARDVLTIPLFVSVSAHTKNSFFAKSVVSMMLKSDFQEQLTHSTGMGPVNSTVQPLDKQATDVRFWAAASNTIAVAKYEVTENDTNYLTFLDNVRIYLVTNK